jgi:esterase/lipase
MDFRYYPSCKLKIKTTIKCFIQKNRGEGKPLLILHGFLGMLDNWKTLGVQFATEGFQVHAGYA